MIVSDHVRHGLPVAPHVIHAETEDPVFGVVGVEEVRHLDHALGLLHRQQAQRREVDAGFGLFAVGDRLVGLAGVGRPDVEHEVPLDTARHREELGDVLGDLLLDQLPLPGAVLDEWVVAVVFEQIDGLAQRNLRVRPSSSGLASAKRWRSFFIGSVLCLQ